MNVYAGVRRLVPTVAAAAGGDRSARLHDGGTPTGGERPLRPRGPASVVLLGQHFSRSECRWALERRANVKDSVGWSCSACQWWARRSPRSRVTAEMNFW